MEVNQKKCIFCDKLHTDGSFQLILKRALYCKYSQSQNFFYERDISDILEDKQVLCTIRFKDNLQYDEQNEFMRRFYRFFESDDRMPALLEYYKFHINLPRNFFCKIISKRMEKNRELQYCKIKMELGLCEDPKQESPRQVKDTSDDRSVSQMKNLLKDLKIESTQTDISRASNTTILKDLVKMIGNTKTKTKPFEIFNYNKLIQKQINPVIEAQKKQCLLMQQTVKPKIIKSPPLTQRIPKTAHTSRQNSAHKFKIDVAQATKRPPQLKSRQASLGNIELTKSCQNTVRNNPQQNELLMELAKKVFSTKIAFNSATLKKKPGTQQNHNFFVKGRTDIKCSLKNLEELKNSMRSLNCRQKTPSQLLQSHHGTPNHKKR